MELHWLTTTAEAATDRAQNRAARDTGYFHDIGRDGNAHPAALMQPPTESEGLTIRQV